MFARVFLPIVLGLRMALVPFEAAAQQPNDPLSFMVPLVGTWIPDPDWMAQNPGVEGLVPLVFAWEPGGQALRYHAGLPGPGGRLMTTGSVVWNPSIKRAEFIVNQGNDGLLFKGYYEPVDSSTVRRVYEVHYAERAPLRFRETFFLLGPDTLDWLTEWAPEGVWIPRRGSGAPEFRAIRADTQPEPLPTTLGRLIGEWRIDAARSSDAPVQALDGSRRVTFEWGTDERWLHHEDHREVEGELSVQGTALVAFDPHERVLSFEGHNTDGVRLQGTWVVQEDDRIERHYVSFSPDGRVTSWIDRWRWDPTDEACFEWTTEQVAPTSETHSQFWMCRDP